MVPRGKREEAQPPPAEDRGELRALHDQFIHPLFFTLLTVKIFSKCKEKCFRVQRYAEGTLIDVFQEHVPSHRISSDSETEILRALLSHFAGWNGIFILHARLNDRRGGPSRYPGFTFHVTYPEKGVLRRYISSGNVTAWSDSVISPGSFRCEGKSHVSA